MPHSVGDGALRALVRTVRAFAPCEEQPLPPAGDDLRFARRRKTNAKR